MISRYEEVKYSFSGTNKFHESVQKLHLGRLMY